MSYWRQISRAVVFVDTDLVPAHESPVGDLVENKIEARLVYETTETLLRSGVRQNQIGIISLYRQHIKHLSYLLQDRKDIEILTADRSQGRDKDCILISFVRSNDTNQARVLMCTLDSLADYTMQLDRWSHKRLAQDERLVHSGQIEADHVWVHEDTSKRPFIQRVLQLDRGTQLDSTFATKRPQAPRFSWKTLEETSGRRHCHRHFVLWFQSQCTSEEKGEIGYQPRDFEWQADPERSGQRYKMTLLGRV